MQDSRQHHARVPLVVLISAAWLAGGYGISIARADGGPAGTGLFAHSEQGHPIRNALLPPRIVPMGYTVRKLVDGIGPMHAAAGPATGGFDAFLYVVLSERNEVVRVDAAGQITPFADLGPVSPGGYPTSPTFDLLGTYTGALFVADLRHDSTCDITPDGDPSVFTVNGNTATGALACDPFGSFGGRLFFTDTDGLLNTIDPDGAVSVFATGVGHRGASITFAPDGAMDAAMFVTDPDGRRVLRLLPGHLEGDPASIFSNLAPVDIEPISLAISTGGPFGVNVGYVMDASSGRIVRLAADGSYLDEFATGIEDPVAVELPRTGSFAGRMVVTTARAIWLIVSEVPADLDGNGAVDAADLRILLAAWGSCPPEGDRCSADLDGDGDVDGADLAILMRQWE